MQQDLLPQDPSELAPPQECLQLKGGLIPVTIIQIQDYQEPLFSQQLKAKIHAAQGFFSQANWVISLDPSIEPQDINLSALLDSCQQQQVKVIALRSRWQAFQNLSAALNIGFILDNKDGKTAHKSLAANKNIAAVSDTAPVAANQPGQQLTNKIISRPIRSGQQIYAAGANLIIMNSVSEGAEVIADGDIHVYGALRGRAIAGAQGHDGANIICAQFDAELVSIAGNYKISENIEPSLRQCSVVVKLDKNNLVFEHID